MAKQVKPDAVEQRALRPPVTPNNNPAGVPPASVAEPDYRPGDPDGVVLVDEGPGSPSPRSVLRPSPWSGWPADWAMPAWTGGGGGHLEELCDIAWMCLDLNTWVLSSMPAYLVNAAPSLDAGWMANPDPDIYSSWEEFARALFWDFWCGEAFVLITARYATGWPARFHVVEPWFVNVDIGGDGLRSYSIGGRPVPDDDMIHLRYRATASQARGQGPLEVGRARLVAAQMLSRYASNFVAGGGLPAGIITHPEELTAEQSYSLQQQWVMSRTSSMGLPAVLSGGVEFNPTQQSPAQMGLVELSQMNEARIAVLMGVPPFLVGLPSGGDSMTYSNVNALFDYHWRSSLRPKAQHVMRGLSERLLPLGTTVEINRDAYVQPGPLERAQTWDILIRNGVLTAEQVAEFERFSLTPPVAGRPIDSGALL